MVDDARRAGRSLAAPSVLLSYEQSDEVVISGSVADHEVLPNGVAVTDLTFFVQVQGRDVHLAIEYRGEVVGAAAAARLLDAVEAAIFALVQTPLHRIDGAGVRLSTLVGAPLDTATGRDVVADIEQRLREGGAGTAVLCGADRLDWAEFDSRSRDVAAELAARGVGAGDRVVVAVERSPAVVAAIVGVLRCGAAYVPADPAQPPDRVRRTIELADATAAVTTEASADLFVQSGRSTAGPRVRWRAPLILAPDGSIVGGATIDSTTRAPAAKPDAGPDDPAYVIFTSGSTGTPRAVTVSRANLTWSTRSRGPVYGDDPERFLLVSSIAFDSSIVGLFWTLSTGGTLVVPTDDEVVSLPICMAEIDEGTFPEQGERVEARHNNLAGHSFHPSSVPPRFCPTG